MFHAKRFQPHKCIIERFGAYKCIFIIINLLGYLIVPIIHRKWTT